MQKVRIGVSTGFYRGHDIDEKFLEPVSFAFEDREQGVDSLKLDYPEDSWMTPDNPWVKNYLIQHEPGSRHVKIKINVNGERPGEWSGEYTLYFDLSKEDPRPKILETIERGRVSANKSAEEARFACLIKQATTSCTGGQYSQNWIYEDSKWHGLCGGRNYFRWLAREEEKLLLLFHRYGGIIRGMDGTNTPWACIVAIRFEERPEGNTFELLQNPQEHLSYMVS